MPLVSSTFSLDIVPGKSPPLIHVSKSDIGRSYSVKIFNEGTPLTIPNGTTVKVEGSIGSHTFSENASASGNTVTFTLKSSMTQYEGKVWCKIKFTSNSEVVSSCAFWLDVDRL